MRSIVVIRVVNRLGGFGMAFLGLRLARDLGLDLAGVGTVLAAFGACTIASRVLGGVLATRLGPRPTIVIGLLATAPAQLVIGLGQSLVTVVAGVIALGLAYEIIEPASQGLIAEHVPAERHTSSFALLWAALSVAGVLSGLLAALLSQWGVGALFVADAGVERARRRRCPRLAALAATRMRRSGGPRPDHDPVAIGGQCTTGALDGDRHPPRDGRDGRGLHAPAGGRAGRAPAGDDRVAPRDRGGRRDRRPARRASTGAAAGPRDAARGRAPRAGSRSGPLGERQRRRACSPARCSRVPAGQCCSAAIRRPPRGWLVPGEPRP